MTGYILFDTQKVLAKKIVSVVLVLKSRKFLQTRVFVFENSN